MNNYMWREDTDTCCSSEWHDQHNQVCFNFWSVNLL